MARHSGEDKSTAERGRMSNHWLEANQRGMIDPNGDFYPQSNPYMVGWT